METVRCYALSSGAIPCPDSDPIALAVQGIVTSCPKNASPMQSSFVLFLVAGGSKLDLLEQSPFPSPSI